MTGACLAQAAAHKQNIEGGRKKEPGLEEVRKASSWQHAQLALLCMAPKKGLSPSTFPLMPTSLYKFTNAGHPMGPWSDDKCKRIGGSTWPSTMTCGSSYRWAPLA